MKRVLHMVLGGGLIVLVMYSTVLAAEVRVGGGFGRQTGNIGPRQNNSVVDFAYDFYAMNVNSWQLSLGAGVSALWNDFDNKNVLIFSVLPTVRLYLPENDHFKPFLFATAGPSYLTEKRLGHQLLGGYIAFNDFMGIGTYIGKERRWSAGWCWRHVSNADLYNPNAGIDVPFCFFVGHRF